MDPADTAANIAWTRQPAETRGVTSRVRGREGTVEPFSGSRAGLDSPTLPGCTHQRLTNRGKTVDVSPQTATNVFLQCGYSGESTLAQATGIRLVPEGSRERAWVHRFRSTRVARAGGFGPRGLMCKPVLEPALGSRPIASARATRQTSPRSMGCASGSLSTRSRRRSSVDVARANEGDLTPVGRPERSQPAHFLAGPMDSSS